MLRTCFSTAPSVIQSKARYPAVGAPLCDEREHLELARREHGERIGPASLDDELLHERRIDHGSALGDPLQCIDHVSRLHHPALQEVPNALPALEEVDGRVDLDVGREQEDPDLRELGADRSSGVDPLPRVRRRHADVHHRQIGPLGAYQPLEGCRIRGMPDDLVARTHQQTRDPLAKEDIIVCHHDPQPTHSRRSIRRERALLGQRRQSHPRAVRGRPQVPHRDGRRGTSFFLLAAERTISHPATDATTAGISWANAKCMTASCLGVRAAVSCKAPIVCVKGAAIAPARQFCVDNAPG